MHMIISCVCANTSAVFEGGKVKRFNAMKAVVARKRQMLDSAATLDFLRSAPCNRLKALRGDRLGQHSIRGNEQFRICFVWTELGPMNVEIVDYH